MITESTTLVYVRVDLASRRVVSVTDVQLVSLPGKPVFTVASNQSNLAYYIIEDDAQAEFGITVRAATTEERTTIDAAIVANAEAIRTRSKFAKAIAIKNFYDMCFISRFFARGFYTTLETLAAANYTGTDPVMDDIKVLGANINEAYNEWRHGICKPVIDDMLADTVGLGVELTDEYRSTVEDTLDTFLTTRGFDIEVYHR